MTIGTQSGDLYPAPTPSKLLERTEGLTTTVKIARYVLAGTGTIQHSAPVYVEDAKA